MKRFNLNETPWAKVHDILCFFAGFHPPKHIRLRRGFGGYPLCSKLQAKARGFAEAGNKGNFKQNGFPVAYRGNREFLNTYLMSFLDYTKNTMKVKYNFEYFFPLTDFYLFFQYEITSLKFHKTILHVVFTYCYFRIYSYM